MSDTELDPSIAALLNSTESSSPRSNLDFEKSIMNAKVEAAPKKTGAVPEVDLAVKCFKPITNFFNDTPSDVFDNPTYYKTAIQGEGEASQRLHAVLSKYLTCKDIKDRMVYRQQVIMAYWELVHSIAPKLLNANFAMPKRMLLRYAVILPSLFKPEQKELFAKAIIDNNTGEPVYYLDEWLRLI